MSEIYIPYLELQTSELDVLGVYGKIRNRSTISLLEEKPSSDQQRTFIQMRTVLKVVDKSGAEGDVHTGIEREERGMVMWKML
ncbi:hypothetical protein Fmac_026943 [Flemingia macrophylla]|uniref:Uncharacterized protein n=1 Tax=Flemingia macrophylla TaxID=520843 RepID=A0ABD1LGC3_9FABA